LTNSMRMRKVYLIALICILVVVTACSNSKGSNSATESATETATNSQATSSNATESEKPIDPMAKYDPPIELTTVAFVIENEKYPEGDSIDNNVWKREYLSQLGIKIKNLWVASSSPEVRDQKMSVTIASGKLPDILNVTARELQMLIDSDAIEDLTEVYDQYASDEVKNNLNHNNGILLDSASYKGKLMAIPDTTHGGGTDGAQMIWVRMDWLDKLKLSPPKTMQDVINIARAFTKDDPDGNKKNDTFGLAIGKNVYDGFAGVEGFFAGYHAYPYNTGITMWQKDESTGQLVYSSVQPQVKQGLIALNAMFKEGLIDPEFSVKDGTKVAESVTSGKIGLHFGQFWNASWPLNDMMQRANETAQWMPFPLVSVDDQPAKAYLPQPVPDYFYVVKKGTKNKEAVMKMLNFYFAKIYGENAESSKYHTFTAADGEKIGVHGFATIKSATFDTNTKAHDLISEAMRTGDTSQLNEEFKGYYDQMKEAEAGTNMSGWYTIPIFGENGAYSILKNYTGNNLNLSNEFYGTPTPTMVEKGSFLKQQEFEAFTKIIMDAAAPEAFDKFVADWKQLGGDQITKEVNEWYSNNKK
jgi:putative aldouronate transport system substrate-binding protein